MMRDGLPVAPHLVGLGWVRGLTWRLRQRWPFDARAGAVATPICLPNPWPPAWRRPRIAVTRAAIRAVRPAHAHSTWRCC